MQDWPRLEPPPARSAVEVPDTERDLPMKYVITGVIAASLPLMLMYHSVVGSFLVSVPMTLAMIVLAFLFCSVSGYMAGLVGSSNDPVSGMIISTILAASAMLLVLTHGNAVVGPVAAVMIGAAVCSALSIAGDNVQDLKCGQLVGATPWRQQLMICIGAVTCATVLAPVLNLLNRAYGIGVPDALHPHPLLAPQAIDDGRGAEGPVRRQPALDHHLDRRRHRRADHQPGRVSARPRQPLSHRRCWRWRSASICRSILSRRRSSSAACWRIWPTARGRAAPARIWVGAACCSRPA